MDICPLNNEEDTRPVAFVLSPQQIENVTGCRFQDEEAMRESLEEGRFRLKTSNKHLKVDALLFVLFT